MFPIVAVLDGEPQIVGAWLAVPETAIENAGRDVVALPSLTRMTMLL